MDLNNNSPYGEEPPQQGKKRMKTKERPAHLNKRITPEQHEALAEALEMPAEDINPTDAFAAVQLAAKRGQGDIDEAVEILLDAGVIVEVRRA